jgi:hypothetical protein
MGSELRLRATRLRWRLRGGLMWPAFALTTAADGVLLHALPPLYSGVELIPGLIIASFVNLFLVGAVAPWLARRLAARQPAGGGGPTAGDVTAASPNGSAAASAEAPPYEVLLDRAATGILLAGALGLLAAGLGSRPLVVSETEATEINGRTVRSYVLGHGDAQQRANVDAANTIRIAEGYFRTCIPSADRRTGWCLFVDTNRRPPEVREDSSPTPNEAYIRRGGQ